MSDLVSRVLAAIEETETKADAAVGDDLGYVWTAHETRVDDADGATVTEGCSPGEAAHIAHHDPAAVLRRCQADKRVLKRHTPFLLTRERLECAHCAEASPCADLRDLADQYGISVEEEMTGE